MNLAARATKLAQPESVLVPESLTQEVSDARHFRFEQVGRRPLKGFAEPVTLYALMRREGGPA